MIELKSCRGLALRYSRGVLERSCPISGELALLRLKSFDLIVSFFLGLILYNIWEMFVDVEPLIGDFFLNIVYKRFPVERVEF